MGMTGFGDYTRNVGYKTEPITYEFETKPFYFGCDIKLFADIVSVIDTIC